MKRHVPALFTLALIVTGSSLLPAPVLALEAPKSHSSNTQSQVQTSMYSNAEVRSILNGLGFTEAPEVGAEYPFTSYNGALNDRVTIDAIKAFQKRYRLKVTGRIDAQTRRTLQRVMKTLHQQLNEFMGADLELAHPTYDRRTIGVVQIFQHQIGAAIQDGIARTSDRQQLQKLIDSHSRSSNNMGN
ncbi:MAG: peptidoglycan-binding protein [Myxacorys californica WJT36-NPBG1]|nr:peptidoglycan-binding protein [Myxacorys californica WJT36-NPBG1]